MLIDLIIDGMLPNSIVSLDAFKRYTHGKIFSHILLRQQYLVNILLVRVWTNEILCVFVCLYWPAVAHGENETDAELNRLADWRMSGQTSECQT